jgi:hypothetical protein
MRFTTTRIIGIAVLLLSIFFYFTNPSAGVYLLLALSLILSFAPEKYGEDSLKKLINALNKNLLIIVLFDALFWLVFFVTAYFSNSLFEKTAKSFLGFDPKSTISSLDMTKVQAATSSIKTFFIVLGLIALGFIILNLLAYSLSRCFIWFTLLKKKFNLKLFMKFLGFNSMWWVLWAVIFVFLVLKREPEILPLFAGALIILYIHTSTVAHYYLTKTNKVKESFMKAFAIAYGKLHLFILPYSFILLVYFILSKIITYIPLGNFSSTANLVILLLIMNVGRAYLKNVLD